MGGYTAELTEVSSRLYVPNVRHGHLNVPLRYRRSSNIPVIALQDAERVAVNPGHFAKFCPRQRQAATNRIAAWLPPLKDPDVLAVKLEREAFIPYLASGLPDNIAEVRLEAGVLAKVSVVCGNAEVVSSDAIAAGLPSRMKLKGHPLLALRYDPSGHKRPAPDILHEYKHLVQHETEPIFAAADKAEEDRYFFSLEMEAYHVGALAVRGMEAAGMTVPGGHYQTERDDWRTLYNGNGNDMFRASPELHDCLVAEGLGVSRDIGTIQP